MSKVEDFAIKKYPVSIKDIYGHKVDVNLWQRKACVEGYHQAEKDTIEKAAKWLENNLEGVVGGSIYIEDFLKAMRDE